MRDIVSIAGTIRTGLTAIPSITSTQTSPNIDLRGYDGCMIYFLVGTMTGSGGAGAGNMTPLIYVAPDSSGSPGSWSLAAAADLVLWTATSSSDYTPVKQLLNGTLPDGVTTNTTNQPMPINALIAASQVNQRVGYIGGVAGTSDWLRIVSTATTISTFTYDVVVLLGRPRVLPAYV